MSIDLELAESIWSLARVQLNLVVNLWHKISNLGKKLNYIKDNFLIYFKYV